MEYKVLENSHSLLLEKEVNEYLLKGWIPQGGIAVTSLGFYQAIVKGI
nr:DUF1737 domain-containing protein [Elizabethkingia sp. ASV34]